MRRDPFRELIKQIIIALFATAMDFVIYKLLLVVADDQIHIFKGVSFLCSGVLAGAAHFIWDDVKEEEGNADRVIVFLLTLAVNVGVNYTALRLLPNTVNKVLYSFLLAAGCALGFDFLRIRRHYIHEFLVERNREQFVQRTSSWVEISRRRANE